MLELTLKETVSLQSKRGDRESRDFPNWAKSAIVRPSCKLSRTLVNVVVALINHGRQTGGNTLSPFLTPSSLTLDMATAGQIAPGEHRGGIRI
jgi:hypothetical protein